MLNNAMRRRWETVTTERGQQLGISRGIGRKSPADIVGNLGMVPLDLVQQLADRPWTEAVQRLDLALPAQAKQNALIDGRSRGIEGLVSYSIPGPVAACPRHRVSQHWSPGQRAGEFVGVARKGPLGQPALDIGRPIDDAAP